ncbi:MULTISPECIES: DUF3833 family protein [Roseobacteraceae]|uniref:DUF3833 family protein n=1 Tax=Roseobacteraceae TaxID=2854170 RepID=UPI00125F20DC|nr:MULTISPECIES: DUF3833 family protein [Roseobacteraceae]KAB6715757.1 DUF3833 domain-containing protein [Roseobacter sp. TSBP12]|tara:strand:- start:2736 stop:3299 length:564 start_codon:yes stop_codon:yes gene_type:complete
MKLILIVLVVILLLAVVVLWRPGNNFRAQKPADYADTLPGFDPQVHLNGLIESEGVIYGLDGRVASRFVARMSGTWDGLNGTLREEFTYASGGQQIREWTLSFDATGALTATAPDIIGTATGQLSGATLSMRYKIKLEDDAGGHVLDVTDWLYLAPNGVIVNRSEMRKFGIKVAELVATMRPAEAAK